MSKFNLNQLLGAGIENGNKRTENQNYKITFIPVHELDPSEDNFYSVEQIEELKTSIATFGIKQNLIVKQLESGRYRVIAGHRRRLAALALAEEGNKEFEKIPCMVETEEDELRERLLLITTNSTSRQLSDWEKIQQAKEMKSILEQIKKRDKIPGRLRDLIASVLDTSPTQVGRMEAIDKNLSSEFKDELKEGRITLSTAYELSGMPEMQQQKSFQEYREKGNISIKDAKQAKQGKEELSISSEKKGTVVGTFVLNINADNWNKEVFTKFLTDVANEIDGVIECLELDEEGSKKVNSIFYD